MKRYSAEEIEFMDYIAIEALKILLEAGTSNRMIEMSRMSYKMAQEMLFERNQLINEVTK